MEIIEYQKQYKKDFIRLNTAWITKYFTMEEADHEILENVDALVNAGSMVFFAIEANTVLATCMTVPKDDDTWEICKLAADDRCKGRGAGSAVFQACMDYAISHGAKKLTLVSNHILKPALHIYEKFGFSPIEFKNTEYNRGDVEYEYLINA